MKLLKKPSYRPLWELTKHKRIRRFEKRDRGVVMIKQKKQTKMVETSEVPGISRTPFIGLISNSAFVGGTIFCLMLIIYSLFQTDIFSMFQFQEILINGSTAMALAAVGESFVIITGGFDLSVGALIALVNCVLTTQMVDTPGSQVFWSFICLLIGLK